MSKTTDEAWAAWYEGEYYELLREAVEATARDIARQVATGLAGDVFGDLGILRTRVKRLEQRVCTDAREIVREELGPLITRLAKLEARVEHLYVMREGDVRAEHDREPAKHSTSEVGEQERESRPPNDALIVSLRDMVLRAGNYAHRESCPVRRGGQGTPGTLPECNCGLWDAVRDASRFVASPPAPPEGSEGEVEPVAVRVRSSSDDMWLYFRAGARPDVESLPTAEPLYSHKTVQRLQRELEEAGRALHGSSFEIKRLRAEIVNLQKESVSNDAFHRVATESMRRGDEIYRLNAEIANLRNPENWEVVLTLDRASLPRIVVLHTVRYIGPDDHESPSVSDNAGSDASVSGDPPESEGESDA
jgi:hypothetical protein